MLLGLFCLLPLSEVVNVLIKYAQGRDVFISAFVATINICQTNLYMMYLDPSGNYQREHFQVFSDVVENSSNTITQDWVIDLNNGTETFDFHMANHN
jgi:hypothetical protein